MCTAILEPAPEHRTKQILLASVSQFMHVHVPGRLGIALLCFAGVGMPSSFMPFAF